MCGRFTLQAQPKELIELFELDELPEELRPRFNIAPSQSIAAVGLKADCSRRGLTFFQWGFIPSWAKSAKESFKPINAKTETVATLATFRDSFKKKRCIIPADGFYEWKAVGKEKQPYHIRMRSRALFGFAEIWSEWKGDSESVKTAAIITTEASVGNSKCQKNSLAFPASNHHDDASSVVVGRPRVNNPARTGRFVPKQADVDEYLRVFRHVGFFFPPVQVRFPTRSSMMSHLSKSAAALAVVLLLLVGSSASATNDPIPGVDIIVRKYPPGGIVKSPPAGKDGKFVLDKQTEGKYTIGVDLEKVKAITGTTKATVRHAKSVVNGVEVHEVIVTFDKNAKDEFKPVEIELGAKGGKITGTISHEVPAKTPDKK